MRIRLEERVLDDEGYRQIYQPESESIAVLPQASRLSHLKPGNRFVPRQVQIVRKGLGEAHLIRALEEKGIGRPSTYALVVTRLVEHGYVRRRSDGALEVTDLGRQVLAAVSEAYPFLASYDFTAHMEQWLDALARGQGAYTQILRSVWGALHGGT